MFKYFVMFFCIISQTISAFAIADTPVPTVSQTLNSFVTSTPVPTVAQTINRIYSGEIEINNVNKVPFTAQLKFSDENQITGNIRLSNVTREILAVKKVNEHNFLLTLEKPQQLSILFSSDFSKFSGFDSQNLLWTAALSKKLAPRACKKRDKSTSISPLISSYTATDCDYYEKLGVYKPLCDPNSVDYQKMSCFKACQNVYRSCQTGCFVSREGCNNCAAEFEICKKSCQ